MTPNEIIKVVEAYVAGKKIECRKKNNGFSNWVYATAPTWDFSCIEYRVKAEPKYRPWKPREVPLGKLIIYSNKPKNKAIISATRDDDDLVYLAGRGWYSIDMLFVGWEMEDGSPCGVLEE